MYMYILPNIQIIWKTVAFSKTLIEMLNKFDQTIRILEKQG